jgi:two-component system sensor histidine kinase PilS (NtrC family)
MASLPLGIVDYPDSFWRSLHQLNRFRGFLALFFLLAPFYASGSLFDEADPRWLALAGLLYGLTTGALGRSLIARRPRFHHQLFLQVGADVAFITSLMGLSGGNASGIGLLLIVPMAAAGMHPQTRMVLLLAALGTLAVLLEQTLRTLLWHGGADGYLRAGLLAFGFFTVSGLSHALAKGTLSSARLAGEKAAQAANLARINDWVIQELEDGILVVDGRGQILQHNARAEQLLNSRIFPNAGLSHCCPTLAALWHDWRGSGSNPEAPFVTGGEGRRLRARFTELEPTRNEGAMILLQDMTALERAAQNMKLAALGRLTANLAHEIRNPLAAIQQAAALLGEEPSTPTMARLARIIDDNTKRLNGLVEDVLSLNRRDRLQQESIPIESFLRDFVAQFSQAESVPLGVIRLSAPAQLSVRFDRLHLTQILWNLIRNAWRYCTRAPGSIELRAAAVEGAVLIDVFNDGAPVSPEMQQRLFEPFYTTDSRGTGLGLYIARELAEANGGTLRYVDKAGGALFRLSCHAEGEATDRRETVDEPSLPSLSADQGGSAAGSILEGEAVPVRP